jgi:thiamine biosynthesis protein ThiS
MKLTINGMERELDLAEGASVLDLLGALGLRPEVVAVEVNGALAPRATHADHSLVSGDRIECVTLVGGG